MVSLTIKLFEPTKLGAQVPNLLFARFFGRVRGSIYTRMEYQFRSMIRRSIRSEINNG